MRVASVCSGAGGFDLGMHRAGHETVLFCEVDPWRRQLLARHWPGVPIHHDLTELTADYIPPCDLLIGGTPCQDLSNAGQQAGIDGERSGLFWNFAQLRIDLHELHGTEWSLWENVAGALSSNAGHDFAAVLSAHVGAEVSIPTGGWPTAGVAIGPWGTAEWRLLDAQFFGVPQRRRRVFVAGHLGADSAVEVLADPESSPRDPAPRRRPRPHAPDRPASGARVAGSLTAVEHGQGWRIVASTLLGKRGKDGGGLAIDETLVAATLTAGSGSARRPGRRREDDKNVVAFHMTQDPIPNSVAPSLGATESGTVGVAFGENQRGELVEHDIAHALAKPGGKPGQGYPGIRTADGVRRLTPTECERLMGWPDGWTLDHGPSLADAPQSWPSGEHSPIDPKPDGRRYSACGDGVVAHVAEWIGLNFASLEAIS